jgi:hypothetical protein
MIPFVDYDVVILGHDIGWRGALIALLVLIAMVIHTIPVWIILRRAGFGGWWSLFRYVPLLGLILLWVFAFVPWPALDEKRG